MLLLQQSVRYERFSNNNIQTTVFLCLVVSKKISGFFGGGRPAAFIFHSEATGSRFVKTLQTPTRLKSVLIKKTEIFILTAVKISNFQTIAKIILVV